MTAIIHRLASAALLMVWGSVLCALYFSGRVSAYLHPTFQPFTVVCGAVLVVMALLVPVSPPGEEGGHSSTSSGSWFSKITGVLILTVPLFFALSASKDQFGASTVQNRTYIQDVSQLPGAKAPPAVLDPLPTNDGSADTSAPPVTEAEAEQPVDRNEKGDIKAEVIDLLYAAQLDDMRTTFEDKQIEVIGQLMPAKENNPHGDRYDVVRMFMTCCAADVQPIALPVHPGSKPAVPDMTWVKVSGKATFPLIGGQRRPLIEGATIEKTDPPEDTYLY